MLSVEGNQDFFFGVCSAFCGRRPPISVLSHAGTLLPHCCGRLPPFSQPNRFRCGRGDQQSVLSRVDPEHRCYPSRRDAGRPGAKLGPNRRRSRFVFSLARWKSAALSACNCLSSNNLRSDRNGRTKAEKCTSNRIYKNRKEWQKKLVMMSGKDGRCCCQFGME